MEKKEMSTVLDANNNSYKFIENLLSQKECKTLLGMLQNVKSETDDTISDRTRRSVVETKWIVAKDKNGKSVTVNDNVLTWLIENDIFDRVYHSVVAWLTSNNNNNKKDSVDGFVKRFGAKPNHVPWGVFVTHYKPVSQKEMKTMSGLEEHYDSSEFLSMVIGISGDHNEDGLYIKSNPRKQQKKEFVRLKKGDAFVFTNKVLHGVEFTKRKHERVALNLFY